ncbi:MAG: transposase [Elusimicrobiota bacterium]|jgi:REP element-mobilizing transposase RayT
MARALRINQAGLFYHVTARGNNKQSIFTTEEDYGLYLELLADACQRYSLQAHAYCLMENHLHLLLRTLKANMSEAIEWLNGRYARLFNLGHSHIGHVFQRRFWSECIWDEAYLHEVGRYIHMNPVRAGIVETPEAYRWSSFREYLQSGSKGFIRKDELLSIYAGADALADFYRFTVARMETKEVPPDEAWYFGADRDHVHGGDGTGLQLHRDDAPEMIFEKVAREYGCDSKSMKSLHRGRGNDRRVQEARWIVVWLLRKRTSLRLEDIAGAVGFRSARSLCNVLRKMRRQYMRDPSLRMKVGDIESDI